MSKYPKGTLPAGCREQDQQVYRDLIAEMKGINVAEHFGKQVKRTWFQSEKAMRKNSGQRIDHVIAEPSLLDKSSALRITDFEVLNDFGGSRKGSSDHCPLWITLERSSKKDETKTVLAAKIDDAREATDNEEAMRKIGKLLEPAKTPGFEEKEPSSAFTSDTEEIWYDEEMEFEDEVCNLEDDEAQRPFEDCAMPIVRCSVIAGNDDAEIKMLMDSGSSLDLIAGSLDRRFRKRDVNSSLSTSKFALKLLMASAAS